ncbi:MAG: polysaccharide biosynthesis/export family protein [Planctomycetes bacterium]|nr:polysaccharide biosynthesis/export family protein [Planctomycetota bacterium]
MKTGERWSSWKTRAATLVLMLPLLPHVPGCVKDRLAVEKNLMAQQSERRNEGVAESYRAGCPDVIELVVPSRPEFNGRYAIGADGRIDLGDYGNLRVEGRTPPEIARLLVQETGASTEGMQVRVVDFRSQHLLLFGEVIGWQGSVPYRGPETVLALLQRVGGITPGAEPKDVYVLRPHLGDFKRPEAFKVDLHAIVLKHDHRTNIRLAPFDQIYVGETRQAQVEKAMPPWLRSMYQTVGRTTPEPSADEPKSRSIGRGGNW